MNLSPLCGCLASCCKAGTVNLGDDETRVRTNFNEVLKLDWIDAEAVF